MKISCLGNIAANNGVVRITIFSKIRSWQRCVAKSGDIFSKLTMIVAVCDGPDFGFEAKTLF